MKHYLIVTTLFLSLFGYRDALCAEELAPPTATDTSLQQSQTAEVLKNQIILKNGDRITGSVVSMEKQQLKVKTDYAGEVIINWADVESLMSKAPLTIEVLESTNESVREAFPKTRRMETYTIPGREGIAKEDIKRINISQYRYAGATDIGGNRTTGNTDTTAFNASAEMTIQASQHRVDLTGKYAFSHADGTDTANNARGTLRYDYFLTKKLFVTLNEFLEQDQLQLLDIRSTTGIGGGYQFFDRPEHQLSGYVGPAFVYEQYQQGRATKTSTITWVLEWKFDLLSNHVTTFHKQLGSRDFAGERTNALRWVAEQGIRIKLYTDLYLKLEYDFRFNSDPEPGRKESDQAFIWGIGYQFSN